MGTLAADIVEQHWQHFRAKVVHPDAPEYQVKAIKGAFFAGALTALEILGLAVDDNRSEEAGILILSLMHQECEAYFVEHHLTGGTGHDRAR